METINLEMPRKEAKRLYREYKTHLHYSKPIDRECMRAYQLLAQGRLIIQALASVRAAGLNAEGFPKLGLARGDVTACHVSMRNEGSCRMSGEGAQLPGWRNENRSTSNCFNFPAGSFPESRNWRTARGLVPGVPLHLRPKRAIANYHILWEAEWTKVVPRDPFLLRRIGKADLWLVVAQWDLTEVERAALATRLS